MKIQSECAEILERIKTWAHYIFQQLHPKVLGCYILVGLHRVFMWCKREFGNLIAGLYRLRLEAYDFGWAFLRVIKAFLKVALVMALVVIPACALLRLYPEPCEDPVSASEAGHLAPDKHGRINLKQCWSDEQRKRFYTTDEGSLIIPYDLLKYLERPQSSEFFLSVNTIRDYGFLSLEDGDFEPFSSAVDVDGLHPTPKDWPLGFVLTDVKDGAWEGKWFGVTCAACHTREIEYREIEYKDIKDAESKKMKRRIRIDGGPAMADVNGFLTELYKSVQETRLDAAESDRYYKNDGTDNYVTGKKRDGEKFKRYAQKFQKKTTKQLRDELKTTEYTHASWHNWNNPLWYDPPDGLERVEHGFGRLDAFGVIYNQLLNLAGTREAASIPSAPVSYPFLWDTSQHDWTQWNGISPRIPKGRNIGQVIGTFGKFEFPPPFSVISSIPLRNLRKLQDLVDALRSPAWPDILGTIDRSGAAYKNGKEFYKNRCKHCHAIQERDKPLRRISVHLADADVIGSLRTDPTMTFNAHTRKADEPAGPKKIQSILLSTVTYILIHPAHSLLSPRELWDTIVQFAAVPLECTGEYIWRGLTEWQWQWKRCVIQDETKMFYKGRPLDGIWATAPYLHNDSVANLYELSLPEEERMKGFCVGSREFDPENVGFETKYRNKTDCKKKPHEWFWFDTTLPGNRNTGHEYGVRRCDKTDKKCKEEREREIYDLIEYLKSL